MAGRIGNTKVFRRAEEKEIEEGEYKTDYMAFSKTHQLQKWKRFMVLHLPFVNV